MELPLLLPQKPPIVMVDRLLDCSLQGATTRLHIRADNIFVYNGFFAEPGLVENIAQTAAAQAGCLAALAGLTDAPVGYIATVDHLHIHELPPVGATIETTIEVKNQVMNVTIISGKSACDGRMMAQCEMKIFIRN